MLFDGSSLPDRTRLVTAIGTSSTGGGVPLYLSLLGLVGRFHRHRGHLHSGARAHHQHLQPGSLGYADINLCLFCTSQHRLHLCQFLRRDLLRGGVQAVRVAHHVPRDRDGPGRLLFPGNRDGARRADVLLPAVTQPEVSDVLDGGLVRRRRFHHRPRIRQHPAEPALPQGHVGRLLHCRRHLRHVGEPLRGGQFPCLLLQRADADLLPVYRLPDRSALDAIIAAQTGETAGEVAISVHFPRRSRLQNGSRAGALLPSGA